MAFNGSYSHDSLDKCKSTLFSSHLTPSLPSWPICSWGHWAMTGMARKKEADCHRMGHSTYLFLELLSRSSLLMIIYTWHKNIHIFCPFGELNPDTSYPGVFIANFSITLFTIIWLSSQSIGYSPLISEQLHIWPFLLPNGNTMCTAQCSAHCEDFPLPVVFRVVPEGLVMLQLSTSGKYLHNVHSHQ